MTGEGVKDKAVFDTKVMRIHKDTVFRMLFRDKKKLLSLFNAVNGTHYEDPEELQVNTLENAIYMNMKGDVPVQLIYKTVEGQQIPQTDRIGSSGRPVCNGMYPGRDPGRFFSKEPGGGGTDEYI